MKVVEVLLIFSPPIVKNGVFGACACACEGSVPPQIKNYNQTILVDEARNQAEDAQNKVPVALLPATQESSKSVKSIPPLAAVDLKGKGVETPQSNRKKKTG